MQVVRHLHYPFCVGKEVGRMKMVYIVICCAVTGMSIMKLILFGHPEGRQKKDATN